eukprot:7138017-Ditylum_brightwellii.AAC.1
MDIHTFAVKKNRRTNDPTSITEKQQLNENNQEKVKEDNNQEKDKCTRNEDSSTAFLGKDLVMIKKYIKLPVEAKYKWGQTCGMPAIIKINCTLTGTFKEIDKR